MNEFDIDNIDRLKWLLLVGGAALVVVYGFIRKGRALRTFATADLLGVLTPDVSRPRQVIRALLVLAGMTAIVLALVGPRWGRYFAEVHKKQLDVVICLDVSRSMLAEDAGMSRLDRAKDDIGQLLDAMSGGMVALVTFAGRAELACPLTDDYEFVRLVLEDVGVHSAPVGGTNLGAAIEAGAKAFGDAGRREQVMLLITDGEDHEDKGVEAARMAHDKRIAIHCVGIGDTERGGRIPITNSGQQSFVMHEGQQVWSKLDPETLERIARAGGGEYHPSALVTGTQRTLEWLYRERIAPKMERTKEDKRAMQLRPRFHWLAGLALAFLLLECVMSERRAVVRTDKGLNAGR